MYIPMVQIQSSAKWLQPNIVALHAADCYFEPCFLFFWLVGWFLVFMWHLSGSKFCHTAPVSCRHPSAWLGLSNCLLLFLLWSDFLFYLFIYYFFQKCERLVQNRAKKLSNVLPDSLARYLAIARLWWMITPSTSRIGIFPNGIAWREEK